jgi:hypothetical protein
LGEHPEALSASPAEQLRHMRAVTEEYRTYARIRGDIRYAQIHDEQYLKAVETHAQAIDEILLAGWAWASSKTPESLVALKRAAEEELAAGHGAVAARGAAEGRQAALDLARHDLSLKIAPVGSVWARGNTQLRLVDRRNGNWLVFLDLRTKKKHTEWYLVSLVLKKGWRRIDDAPADEIAARNAEIRRHYGKVA